jgi:hypothetical protein
MVETTAKIENDCKIVELMFRNSKYYDITIKENYGLQINLKSARIEYFIRFDEIKQVAFLSGGNIQFIMKNGAYLFIDQTIEMITVGL